MIGQEITEHRRMMILELADGYPSAFPFIHRLESFVRREEIYTYFLRNRIKGERLVTYFYERNGSLLRVVKDVLSEIDRKRMEQVIAGKDMI